jgi:hypothetical protein
MPPDFSQIGPFLVAALVVFAVYRRFKRSFGRQPLRPARMTVRIALLAVIGCLLLPMALRSAQFLAAELIGAALGIALGLWGAQRTRFLIQGERRYYVPHTYTGIAVSLLFLGRLAFRLVQIYPGMPASQAANAAAGTADPSQAFAPASMVRSPLTVGIFFLLMGYYLYYYAWVLWKFKHLKEADFEAEPAANVRDHARS